MSGTGDDWKRRELIKRGLLAGMALGLPTAFGTACSPRRSTHPNVVLITLDTTRVDRLGCYGCDRPTSPNLDALAGESVLYRRAIAPSSWTLPSHASLFTARFTSSHGARFDPEGPLRLMDAIAGPESWDIYRARGLSPGERTLAQLLREAGYATAAVVAGPWMKRVFGLHGGFDVYDDEHIGTVNGRSAQDVTARAFSWLQEVRDQPFFLFLNYYDPHGPLAPPVEMIERLSPGFVPPAAGVPLSLEQKRLLYDAEILYMDLHIGALLETMKRERIYDDSLIVVTADHGELFGEHGKNGHGHYLYQEEIHVPLFVKYPAGEQPASTSDLLVGLTDVLPLICHRLDLSLPAGIQGCLPGEARHPVIAETYPLPSLQHDGAWRAIFEDDHKLMLSSRGALHLYNLRDDPGELTDLSVPERGRARRMLEKLNAYIDSLPPPGEAGPAQEVDEETRDALRNLGYVK